MNASRRLVILFALVFVSLLFLFLHGGSGISRPWRQSPSLSGTSDTASAKQSEGVEDTTVEKPADESPSVAEENVDNIGSASESEINDQTSITPDNETTVSVADTTSSQTSSGSISSTTSPSVDGEEGKIENAFVPGVAKPPGEDYSLKMVITRTKKEDVSWMDKELPDIEKAIYVADDPDAPLHPPKNKGHEVLVYLTYIIDNYDNLTDVTLFMHAHRVTWHNNDILDYNAGEMVRRLNPARVQREGYMNLRCHWNPGCPEWIHPGAVEAKKDRKEEPLFAQAWSELFPLDPIPQVLAQPCCAQFALSRDRIRSIPLETFEHHRDWILNTPMTDYFSGRIYEYTWQVVFTGQPTYCPEMHTCYCDGYGVCFGGKQELDDWFKVRFQTRKKQDALNDWHNKNNALNDARAAHNTTLLEELKPPEPGLDETLQREVDELNKQLQDQKAAAIERGKDPKLRAEELGREWHEGDGF